MNKQILCKKIVLKMLIIIIALIVMFPFLVLLTTALKSDGEIAGGFVSLFPETALWENIPKAMGMGDWPRYFMNSFIITVVTVFCSLIINSLAGFAFARLYFKGKNVLFYCAMIGMMLPMQVMMLPVFLQIKEFPLFGGNNLFGDGGIGLINNYFGIILPLIAHPFGVFMSRQFYVGFPKELDEAANLDGCSMLAMYIRIYLPLSKPLFATLGLLKTVDTWNQYTWPLLVTNTTEMQTVQLALNAFKGENVVQWNYLMAATIVIILPVLVLFIFLQKYFVQGIATTGMKD